MNACFLLHPETDTVYATINKTAYTKCNNSYKTYNKACACDYAAFETSYRRVALVDIHCFNHQEVIVERYHGVQQGYEDKNMETTAKGAHKYKELAEKACKRRNSGQREEGECH